MSLSAGIVGLPNVGKSTLFNAITNSKVEAANYPFATIEPNTGIVLLPDKRIDKLVEIVKPNNVVHSTFEFIDIAGLVQGASKGEGLGNKFLANIRNTDAIIHVVRCFENKDITHVLNTMNPIRDIQIVEIELLLADLQTIEKQIDRIKGKAQNSNDSLAKKEYDFFCRLANNMEKEKMLRDMQFNKEELDLLRPFNLLTIKPMIYVGNIDEQFIANPEKSIHFKNLQEYAKSKNIDVISISSKIEQEISELEDSEKQQFLLELGILESGLDILTKKAFKLLNLSTFFTVGKKEIKSWTFKTNSLAPDCAGIIHSDFKKGFIKVEVIKYDDFVKYASEIKVRENGKIMTEGKSYVVQDGDICNFRFNV